MVNCYFGADEWFPVVSVTIIEPNSYEYRYEKNESIEFTDEEISDMRRVGAEFKAWQEEICRRFGKSPIGSFGEFVNKGD